MGQTAIHFRVQNTTLTGDHSCLHMVYTQLLNIVYVRHELHFDIKPINSVGNIFSMYGLPCFENH